MLSHVCVGVTDFPRALAFYEGVMAALDYPLRFSIPENSLAGWEPVPGARPLFLIARPYNREVAAPGNGPMTAFLAPSRAAVDACYNAALALGGTCEGRPGLRLQYHADYYGAYFRDPDGNKLCVCSHHPEPT